MPMSVVVTGICVALGKLRQFLRRIAGDDAAAAVDHRLLRLLDQADQFVQRHVIRLPSADCSRADSPRAADRLRALVIWMFFGISMSTGPGRPVCAM